jgi:hypothetical protein
MTRQTFVMEFQLPCAHGGRQTMPERPVRGPVHFWRFALSLGFCFFTCSHVFGQANQPSAATVGEMRSEVQVRGCLAHVLDRFHFATEAAERWGWFVLIGNTAGLEKDVDREMTLQGRKGQAIHIEGYFEPIPSFEVIRIVEVFEKPNPELSASFTNTTGWHAESNKEYGVRFAHPESMISAPNHSTTLEPNFVSGENVETVGTFIIPSEAYSGANLSTGSFSIFVNRNITNAESCKEFGRSGPQERPAVPFIVGTLQYAVMEGGGRGMGTWYGDSYFHIFQNGLCYEVAFELVEYNAHNAPAACNVPLLSREDNLNLIKPLLASISFFRPTVAALKEANSNAVARVTQFTASSETADAANRGQITF